MIAVLCPSFYDAKQNFYQFLSMLNSWEIEKVFYHSYCVETDENLRYIFVDYRMRKIFEEIRSDIISVDEFFDKIVTDVEYVADHYDGIYELGLL